MKKSKLNTKERIKRIRKKTEMKKREKSVKNTFIVPSCGQ